MILCSSLLEKFLWPEKLSTLRPEVYPEFPDGTLKNERRKLISFVTSPFR